MKSKKSKATNISQKVKNEVYERDQFCVICGKQGIPNAHYISRAKGGLGIRENVVTLCINCHHDYDNGSKGAEYKEKISKYLKGHYPDVTDNERTFDKWSFLDVDQ